MTDTAGQYVFNVPSSSAGQKSILGRLKIHPRRVKNGARIVLGRLGAVRNTQDRIKIGPRTHQEPRKNSKSVPRAPKRPPRGAQRAAKTLQKAPGRTPEVPKGSPREPKSRLNREKIASGTHRVVNSVLERDFSTFLKELVSLE